MRKSLYFLNWWLTFCFIGVGSGIAYMLGLFDKTNAADVTKICFIIYMLFIGFTIRIGFMMHTIRRLTTVTMPILEKLAKRMDLSWFMSDTLLTLGMLGTILGIIYTLEAGLISGDAGSTAHLKTAITVLGKGMGTALYTTAYGLVCGLLLKLQLLNFTKNLEYLEGESND